MRSIKLLVAMAALAAFVAGPVMAQEAAPAPATTDAADAGKGTAKKHTGKKHGGKKHHGKKAAAPADATAPAK